MNEAVQFLIDNGYTVLFFWIFFQQLGLPVPGAPLLIAAGVLAGIGKLNLALIISLAVPAALLSDLFWYHVGRYRGIKVLSLLCRISLDPDSCVRHTKEIFARHGARSLLVAKFIPGLNTVAPPLAGIFRMNLLRFCLFDIAGAFVWVALFAGLGYQFSHEINRHVGSTAGAGPWIGMIVPGCLAAYMGWKYLRRRRFLRHLSAVRITPEEVKGKIDAGEDILIVDVRGMLEFRTEPHSLPGAFHLSIEYLEGNHHKIPRDRDVVLCCN
jgi:membrane protein DedA with SNARE-associated domain